MSFSVVEIQDVFALAATITSNSLNIELSDGRSVSVPLAWYPRLLHGTLKQRTNWRLIGKGEGLNWPDLDEDISVENILLGKRSGESQESLKKWLNAQSSKPSKRAKTEP
jgi:hypothetical protein